MGRPLPSFAGRLPVRTPLVRRVLCGAAGRERGAPRGRRFVMRSWRVAGAVAVGAAAVVWACGGGGSGDVEPGRDAGPPPTDGGDPDAGHPDAGPPDAGPDADPPDAGPPDAGPPDAGAPDGGFVPPPAIPFPTVPGWSFLGPQHGGPHDVFQVSADQGGNIWRSEEHTSELQS